MTAASWRDDVPAADGIGLMSRLIGGVLLITLVIGSFALWVGVPALVLWGIGAVTDDPAEHLVLGLIAVPLAMVTFGIALAALNTVYLRVVGASFTTPDHEDSWRPRLRGPLDRIVGVSAMICLAAFLAWLLLGSGGVGPAGP